MEASEVTRPKLHQAATLLLTLSRFTSNYRLLLGARCRVRIDAASVENNGNHGQSHLIGNR
jgi:hypothetical protein